MLENSIFNKITEPNPLVVDHNFFEIGGRSKF